MSRLFVFSALLLPACQNLGTVELGEFNSDLADGHSAEEHTEVAPGVYLLSSLVASGTVRYVDPARDMAAERAAAAARTQDPDYCYNYDSASYADELTGGTMFMSNPSWYGSSYAMSYDYDYLGEDYDQDYEQVQAYLWSYSRNPPDSISSMAYVYINGEYAGYASETELGRPTALAYATFDAECVDGSLSIETRTYHSWSSNRVGNWQYLYLANTTSATVECCPARE